MAARGPAHPARDDGRLGRGGQCGLASRRRPDRGGGCWPTASEPISTWCVLRASTDSAPGEVSCSTRPFWPAAPGRCGWGRRRGCGCGGRSGDGADRLRDIAASGCRAVVTTPSWRVTCRRGGLSVMPFVEVGGVISCRCRHGGSATGSSTNSALLRPTGRSPTSTNTRFDELQDIVHVMPEDPADLEDLRVGDVGIKRKRCTSRVTSVRRAGHAGALRPEGAGDPHRIHRPSRRPSPPCAPTSSASTSRRPPAGWASPRSGSTRCTRSTSWSPRSTRGSGCTGRARPRNGRRTCTWSPTDPTSTCRGRATGDPAGPDELIDAARKLTALSPCLVPLSFSSPFRDGGPWGGLSARTALRTGARPAVLVFLAEGVPQVPADPSLTQPARLPAEVGRLEFRRSTPARSPCSTASCSAC